MNYYELFSIPVSPVVDSGLLAEKYFELQRKSHPDFFTQGTEVEQETALVQSADINKAYVIFKNENKTLEYFLQISGAITADEKYQLEPHFLMEMMEINETLMEKDGVTIAAELAEIEKALHEEVATILKKTAEDINDKDLEKLKAYYYKKKYLRRILDRLGD
jgi:molecular chaperone HscB